MAASVLRVVIETGQKKVFASAIDFPGWCRSARSESAATDLLLGYRERYAQIASSAGVELPSEAHITVIQRVQGNATTDFGAPAIVAEIEQGTGSPEQNQTYGSLLLATWKSFDVVSSGAPSILRKGPRGGGRDSEGVVEHVNTVEQAYIGKLGIKGGREVADRRQLILDDITAGRSVHTAKEWPSLYAARRITWHVLDHLWEIQDRSTPK